jgi:hypothetical protein
MIEILIRVAEKIHFRVAWDQATKPPTKEAETKFLKIESLLITIES